MEASVLAIKETSALSAEDVIRVLGLLPHPEGGFYRETYRDGGIIPKAVLPDGFSGDRQYSTAIYYLLNQGDISRLHKIAADEAWHHYQGTSITIVMLNPDPSAQPASGVIVLGQDLLAGEAPQAVVPAGWWFGAFLNKPKSDDTQTFALLGCTVAPGFDFADFRLAEREAMLAQYRGETERGYIRHLLP